MNSKLLELLVAVAVGLLSAAGLVEAFSYREQSSYMPIAVLALASFLSLLWMAQSARGLATGRGAPIEATAGDIARFAMIVLAISVYVLGINYAGFFTSTLVMVPVLAALLGYREWKVSIAATVAFVLVLYGVFRLLLSIPLPHEAVLRLFGGL